MFPAFNLTAQQIAEAAGKLDKTQGHKAGFPRPDLDSSETRTGWGRCEAVERSRRDWGG